jgi:hypothetical protein
MKRSLLIRIVIAVIAIPVLLFSSLVAVMYLKQDIIVQELIDTLNEDFVGEIEIEESHISPFANFPYISIDIQEVKIYQDKDRSISPIFDIHDIYLGFDLWTLLRGKFDVKAIKLKGGKVTLVQYEDGSFNIARALESKKEIENLEEELHLYLKRIELSDISVTNYIESAQSQYDFQVDRAVSKLKTSDDHLLMELDSKFMLTFIKENDTTFIKNKHFEVATKLDYTESTQVLKIEPSKVYLEQALFKMVGSVDFDDDMNLDLAFEGAKPDFDLFIAFAPEELAPAFKRYENEGKVYFDAVIQGKSINGHHPFVNANFGCSEAYFSNSINEKKLDDLQFRGHFTNGDLRTTETMELSIEDFNARPDAGVFSGSLKIKNFVSPEIDLKLVSEFELEFLAGFFNIENIYDLGGSVKLSMNFRDIIDLENPERSIEKLNESYFTELEVKDLSFNSTYYHLPLNDLDIKATMDGHEARIEYFNVKIGNSDLSIKGTISDLPAILHHTAIPVHSTLNIDSKFLDLFELTNNGMDDSKPFDEQIENLSMKLAFKSSAKAITESPYLPVGEFFIEDLYAKLKHYPHTLHDFHADVFIEERDFRIIDFKGQIDESDFHFSGKLSNYDLWFEEDPKGDTKIEFAFDSDMLKLEDIFAYGGENHVPEDYRHEELRKLYIHGFSELHFEKGLKSADIYLDKLEASMKVHAMRMEQFSGRIHIEDSNLTVEDFKGKIGKSSFAVNMNYFIGKTTEQKKRNNHLAIKSPFLDFDELFSYSPPESNVEPTHHDSVFSIYDLPFPDMAFEFDIDHLRYHRYMLDDFYMKIRTQENHFLHIDTLSLLVAGGSMNIKGYFNGSDRNHIYFHPNIHLENIDLDKLMFKFENFGQDHLVSEQIHGQLTGQLTGKIHMHADMFPIIDDSEIHLDVQITKGRLENFGPMDNLAEYFKDKNLKKVLFDTLANRIDVVHGVTTIPNMVINTSLGFVEVAGKQDLAGNMEYYLRVPLSMVTKVGMSKLFGKKAEEIDPEQEDDIIYKDPSKRVRYINIKMSGTSDNYKISLQRQKT